jgi:hypothetical protein
MAELADHPNIVQVFRSDVTGDGRPYLVMKYYPQRNMAVRARLETFSVPEVLEIGVRVACAVETAHRAGILHRDIKPANILTSQYGEPGLTDFGIATTGAEIDADMEGLSIPWSPPEVVFGVSQGDRTADVYSLGATLWHLLAGRSPFEDPGGDNSSGAMMRRIRESPPPRTGRADTPASLERLLAQAMAKAPQDRPTSALQVARALQAIETEQHWNPTPLVLLDASDGNPPDEPEDDAPEFGPVGHDEPLTKLKRPGAIVAQQATGAGSAKLTPDPVEPETVNRPPLANVPVAPQGPVFPEQEERPVGVTGSNGGTPPRVREGVPSVEDELHTVRRPTQPVGPTNATDGSEEGRGRHRTRNVVAVVGTAVVVVVLVVFGLASANSPGRLTTQTTLTPPPPTLGTGGVAPDPPAVVATGGQGEVTFAANVANSLPGDQMSWWAVDEPGSRQAIGASTSFTVPATKQVCVIVQVQRGVQTADSAQTCGTPT